MAKTGSQTGQPASSSAGSTVSGMAGAGTNKKTIGEFLAAREYNPLSKLSSYTYKIALYYMDPVAFKAYVNGDNSVIRTFKLIAQSGGATKGVDIRAGGFDLDLYIDDVEITTLISSKETLSATNSTNFKFKIYEPYGFTFPFKLAKEMNLTTNELSTMRGHFLFVLRFYGYNSDGSLAKGETISPNSADKTDPQATFERAFAIQILKMNYRIDNKTMVYNFECVQVNEQVAQGVFYGLVPSNIKISGKTVEEILSQDSTDKTVVGLMKAINDEEEKLVREKQKDKKNIYKIVFEPNVGIDSATMAPDGYYPKERLPMARLVNSSAANERTAYTTKGIIDKKTRVLSFPGGTPIVQAIDQIISESSYIKSTLTQIDKDQTQSISEDDKTIINNPNPKKFAWYKITPHVVPVDSVKDTKTKDYAYEITYRVQKFEVPYLPSVYTEKNTAYYGPHKRYNYWFTGKNTEVISFEQTYNYGWALDVSAGAEAWKRATNTPTVTRSAAAMDNNTQGNNDQIATIKSWLYSPGDNVKWSLKILGDPDYLMPAVKNAEDWTRWYGSDFAINPNSGSVFIEIDFFQGEDYDMEKGILPTDNQIKFMNYPNNLDIKGMTFMVTKVISRLNKGSFTQDLTGILPNFAMAGDSKSQNNETPKAVKSTNSNTNENRTEQLTPQPVDRSVKQQERSATDSNSKSNNSSSSTNANNSSNGTTNESPPRTQQGVADDDSSKKMPPAVKNEGGRDTGSKLLSSIAQNINPNTLLPRVEEKQNSLGVNLYNRR